MDPDFIIPLAGIALPAILVPTIMAFRHAARKRELHHLERMKALEMGQPVPGESNWPQAFALASIGAGVPLGTFFVTWMATVAGAKPEIWIAPAVASVAAQLCSMTIVGKLFPAGRRREAEPHPVAKPHYDPDAYEMAGR